MLFTLLHCRREAEAVGRDDLSQGDRAGQRQAAQQVRAKCDDLRLAAHAGRDRHGGGRRARATAAAGGGGAEMLNYLRSFTGAGQGLKLLPMLAGILPGAEQVGCQVGLIILITSWLIRTWRPKAFHH